KLGPYNEAIELLERSLTLRQRLSEMNPANVIWRHELMLGQVKLGSLYRDRGRIDDATVMFASAVATGEYLVRADSSVTLWKLTLCRAYQRLARQLLSVKRLDQAQALAESMLTLAIELQSEDPQNLEFVRIDAFAHLIHGEVLLATRDFHAASSSLEECIW